MIRLFLFLSFLYGSMVSASTSTSKKNLEKNESKTKATLQPAAIEPEPLRGPATIERASAGLSTSSVAKPMTKSRAGAKSKPAGSAMKSFSIKARYSSKTWTTPDEVVPSDFYDIPGDKRAPNSGTSVDQGIDDLFGSNKDVPDYGAEFKSDK